MRYWYNSVLTLEKAVPLWYNKNISARNAKGANTFLPWYPAQSLEDTRIFYEEKYAQPQSYAYAICLKEDNFPIGYINIGMEEPHDLGYGLRKEFWHRRIAIEAG